jgi:cobalt-zinc-cadmium efflux system membrane fusion protein
VDINEKDLAKVRKGQTAIVMVGAFPELKLKGRITYIADLVNESTRTVKARIEVANPGRKLKPEMFATAELALAADAPQATAYVCRGQTCSLPLARPDRLAAALAPGSVREGF